MGKKLKMTLKDGDVIIELFEKSAPNHVERICKLTDDGKYDNVAFHRVIDGFMAQTGDVKFGNMEDGFNASRAGTGGSDLPNVKAEFSKTSFERGICGMARAMDPNSANSQFFIMFAPAPSLNGQYTAWGQVIKGMEHVDKIARGEPPKTPDRIISLKVEEE